MSGLVGGKSPIGNIGDGGSSAEIIDIIAWAYEDAPNAGSVEYIIPFGGAFSAATLRNYVAGRSGTIKKITVATNTDAHTADVTVTLRKESTNTAMTLTIPASSPNTEFSDERDIAFLADDRLDIKFDSIGSTGTLRIASVSLEVVWD